MSNDRANARWRLSAGPFRAGHFEKIVFRIWLSGNQVLRGSFAQAPTRSIGFNGRAVETGRFVLSSSDIDDIGSDIRCRFVISVLRLGARYDGAHSVAFTTFWSLSPVCIVVGVDVLQLLDEIS
jgi:hypothetical protein